MTEINTLHDLFIDQLRDLYSAEQQIANNAFPRAIDNAESQELVDTLRSLLNEIESHTHRIENIFQELGHLPQGENCEATEGLVTEVEEAINNIADPSLRDVALIAQAQRIAHYKISGYGSACALAGNLGLEAIQQQLHETLEDKKRADNQLNNIALDNVNERAQQHAA